MPEMEIRTEAIDVALTAALDYAPEQDEGPAAMKAAIMAFCEFERLEVQRERVAIGAGGMMRSRIVGPWRDHA